MRDAGSVLLNHYSPLRGLLARTACVASRQGRYTPCNVLPGRAQREPQSHLGLKVTRFGEVPRLSNFDNLFEGPNVRDARSCGQNTKYCICYLPLRGKLRIVLLKTVLMAVRGYKKSKTVNISDLDLNLLSYYVK